MQAHLRERRAPRRRYRCDAGRRFADYRLPGRKSLQKSEETSKTVSCLDSSAGAKWSVVGMKCTCQCPSPPLIPGTVEASTNNHGALTHLGARFTYHCAGAAYFDVRALTSSATVTCALQGGQCR
eukprot:501161_1